MWVSTIICTLVGIALPILVKMLEVHMTKSKIEALDNEEGINEVKE